MIPSQGFCFSFGALNILAYCPLIFKVSDEKSAARVTKDPLYVTIHFSLACCFQDSLFQKCEYNILQCGSLNSSVWDLLSSLGVYSHNCCQIWAVSRYYFFRDPLPLHLSPPGTSRVYAGQLNGGLQVPWLHFLPPFPFLFLGLSNFHGPASSLLIVSSAQSNLPWNPCRKCFTLVTVLYFSAPEFPWCLGKFSLYY